MTLSESAINEILAVLNDGGGADLVRQLAQFGIQELIEAEATEAIGAAVWERTPQRVTHRNGHRPRTLSTKAGDLELGIPKFRLSVPRTRRCRSQHCRRYRARPWHRSCRTCSGS